MVAALIKFSQNAVTPAAGIALAGGLNSAVTVENGDNTDVASWRMEILYAEEGGVGAPTNPLVSTLLAENAGDSTPSDNSLLPDVAGSWRIRLIVWDGPGFTGSSDTDIRVFTVPTENMGLILPPYQVYPVQLTSKPDEMNFESQPFGWTGTDSIQGKLLNSIIKQLDLVLGGAATAIVETGGPTVLQIQAIDDGEILVRVGTEIVSVPLPYSPDPVDAVVTLDANAGVAGSSDDYSRGDHKHGITTGTAVAVGKENLPGTGAALVRAGHGHEVRGIVEAGNTPLDIATLTDGRSLEREGSAIVGKVTASTADLKTGVLVPGSGLITMGGPAGSVSVSSGEGHAVNYVGGGKNPTKTTVVWAAFTDVAITDIATTAQTHLMVTQAGALLQLGDTYPTDIQFRDNIYLGYVLHYDHIVINKIANTPAVGYGVAQEFQRNFRYDEPVIRDIQLGPGTGGLKVTNSPGIFQTEGVGFHANPDNPNTIVYAGEVDIIYTAYYGSGVEGGFMTVSEAGLDALDPNFWDDGGSKETVNNNKTTIQRWYVGPDGVLYMALGQELFDSVTGALAVAGSESFVETLFEQHSTLLTRVVIDKGATDSDVQSDVVFVPAEGSGSSGGSGGGVAPDYDFLTATGWISGGQTTINADPTKVDIAAGSGWVVRFTDPQNPVRTHVEWPEMLAVDIPTIGSSTSIGFAFDASGTLTQKVNTDWTRSEEISLIIVSSATILGGAVVSTADTVGQPAYNLAQAAINFIRRVIGPANEDGNIISANGTNLSWNKSSGNTFTMFANAHVDPELPAEPGNAQLIAPTMTGLYRSATAGQTELLAPSVSVDPSLWDDANNLGTPQSVPNNDYTVIQGYLGAENNGLFWAMGQTTYNTHGEALNAVHDGTLNFEERGQIKRGVLRCFFIVREDVTDIAAALLTNPPRAEFVEAPKFRGSGNTGTGGSSDPNQVSIPILADKVLTIADWQGSDPSQTELLLLIDEFADPTVLITLPVDAARVFGAKVSVYKGYTAPCIVSMNGGGKNVSLYSNGQSGTADNPINSVATNRLSAGYVYYWHWQSTGPIPRMTDSIVSDTLRTNAQSIPARPVGSAGPASDLQITAGNALVRYTAGNIQSGKINDDVSDYQSPDGRIRCLNVCSGNPTTDNALLVGSSMSHVMSFTKNATTSRAHCLISFNSTSAFNQAPDHTLYVARSAGGSVSVTDLILTGMPLPAGVTVTALALGGDDVEIVITNNSAAQARVSIGNTTIDQDYLND